MPRSPRISSASIVVRAVRALDDERRVHAVGVRARELVLAGGEDEEVARELEELLVRDPLAAVVPLERSMFRDVGVECRNVETGLGVNASRDVGNRDDAGAALVQLRRGDAADVAEALDDAGATGELVAEPPRGLLGDHHDPGAGRLATEDGATDRDRLAGDHLGHRVAPLHRVRVHHPGHGLLVRGHVRRRDVGVRADLADQLRREAARELFELAQRERVRVDSESRPSRRRTGAAAAHTSTSSRLRARRTRRARPRGRSASRPWSGRAASSAGRGSRGRSRPRRRPGGAGR